MKSLLLVGAALAALLVAPPAAVAQDAVAQDAAAHDPAAHDPAWQLKPTGVEARLRGLSAVSPRVAWVSGSRGTVLRTTDGGRTWDPVAPPGTADLDFRDVEAFDARTAVVLSIGPGESSRLYRTTDGGRTWALTFRNPEPAAFYDCVAFFDRFRGLAVGDPVDGRFRVLTTRDGGRSWQRVPDDDLPPALPGEFGFAASGQCLTTAGPRDAWIATGGGERARVLHSGDGGRHWSVSDTPLFSSASAGVFAVAFRTPRQGVAVGGDYLEPGGAAANVALTRDAGRTWGAPERAPAGYRSGAAWWGSAVLAVGPTGSDVSRDGGRRWQRFDDGSFDTVDCTGTCWAAGEKGRVGVLSKG
ncbi:WD40/YVTN/BNR-like repeat-containing protein [Saccharothrix syringae]|uniref:Oxidoreductase n=1 Tax=Saccharothrix syringae TaxID=103733 RepID=A0A5Q0H6C0_SACSY|nr:oxidoreductase [Saccharothrix syringae]QFZ21766.1 oxidoreductase [Saccharothrix syringae]